MGVSAKQYWGLLSKYLRPQKWWVLLLAVLIFVNIGLQLINPQIMRNFIDTALVGGSMQQLTMMAVLFIVIALLQQIVAVGATYVGESVSWTATNWLRLDLARHCLFLDMSFHNEHTPGEMIERIDGDINALSTFFSQFTLQIMGNGLLLVGILFMLFREDVRIGLAMTIFVTITLVALIRMRGVAVPHWREGTGCQRWLL